MHRFVLPAILLFLLAADSNRTAAAPRAEITFQAAAGVIEVKGIDAANLEALGKSKWSLEQWQALFSVKLVKATTDIQRTSLLGAYRVNKNTLEFTPRFPLEPGLSYEMTLDGARLPQPNQGMTVTTRLVLPARKAEPPTVVEQIFPTRNHLPENQLKFYIHFSAPMAQGRVYQHIRLLDSKGKTIAWPFLELDEELWNRDGTRFTLFFDPGRIKRGLKPREDLGPALEEGKKYTLEIDANWKDGAGKALKETYRKTFTVGAPDDTCPDMTRWQIKSPEAGTSQALEVSFTEPLDNALAHRMLWVADNTGKKVAGTIKLEKEETSWRFTPDKPWPAGEYRLEADAQLEDLAGNSLGRPFEVDVQRPIEKEIKKKYVQRTFTIR